MESAIQTELLRAAVAGDKVAAGRLLFDMRPRMLAYIKRHLPKELGRFVEPNDILQDTQIEALRRIGTFVEVGDDSLFRWLITIARRQMLLVIRERNAKKRGKGIEIGSEELLDALAMHEHTPSRSAAWRELAFALETCLQQLRPVQQRVIRLRHIDRLPIREVAKLVGRSDKAVQMLCDRGMKRLRDELESMSHYI